MSAEVTTILVMVTVPARWQKLPVREIERKLKAQPDLMRGLAAEVKRWGNAGVVDLSGLQRFIDDRVGSPRKGGQNED